MSFFAHAIAQVDSSLVGIHVLWSGPFSWVYSPAGWTIQRRLAGRKTSLDCVTLSKTDLDALRARHELRIRFGVLTDRDGIFPTAMRIPGGKGSEPPLEP